MDSMIGTHKIKTNVKKDRLRKNLDVLKLAPYIVRAPCTIRKITRHANLINIFLASLLLIFCPQTIITNDAIADATNKPSFKDSVPANIFEKDPGSNIRINKLSFNDSDFIDLFFLSKAYSLLSRAVFS